MPELLVKFDEAISDAAGEMYFAQAAGQKREDGLWEGWLEFIPVKDGGWPLYSERETTQPNRDDLDYWAQGLTRVYLQGALVRAKSATEAIQRDRAAVRGAPAAG
jgi:hypothetical protein